MTNDRKKYCTLFTFAFFIWFVSKLLLAHTTLYEIIDSEFLDGKNFFDYITLILMLIQSIFLQRYSWVQLKRILIFFIPVMISTMFSRDLRLATLLLLIVASKETDFDKIVLYTYNILKFAIPTIILLCLIGILPDHTTAALYRGTEMRYSLGFALPNYLGYRIFQLFSCHVYLRKGCFRKRDYIYGIAAILFIYLVPNFLTSCFCIGLLLVFIFINQILEKHYAKAVFWYKNLLIGVAALSNILSVVLSLYGTSDGIWQRLDAFISFRFSLCHEVFLKYGLSWFGKNIILPSDMLLDSGYICVLLRFGILAYVMFSLVLLLNLAYHRDKEPFLFFILVVLAIDGISQEYIFRASHNIFMLTIGDALYVKQKNTSKG